MTAATSANRHRSELCARLERRREEIEQTVLTRVHSIADPIAVGNPEYVTRLRATVSAAVRYGLDVIEAGRAAAVPIPHELLAQARHAASNGVSLDTVLRRYVAGHTLLGDFIVQEADQSNVDARELQRLARLLAELFDELVDVVAAEYERGLRAKVGTSAERRADTVARLLAGELVSAADLNYELDTWHVGIVVAGAGVADSIRAHASSLGRRLLLITRPEGTVWAWLGGPRESADDAITRLQRLAWPEHAHVAIGEIAHGLSGWRRSHKQAAAALPVALQGPRPMVRYADVAVIASALQDEVLIESLRDLYLEPLSVGSSGRSADLRETLRAYLTAGGNVSSTASALGVSRKTVNTRLLVIEERLGSSLNTCSAELDVALRLDQLGYYPRGARQVEEP